MKLPADKVARLRSFYNGRDVCVTGGAGFIGGHLIDVLLAVGANIAVIDDLSNSSIEHLSSMMELEPERLRFVHGSILDDEALAEAVKGAKTIFHLGALGSVPRSVAEPQRTWSVNATGTVRVLEMARRYQADRVILAASSSAYGDQLELPKVETQTVRPMSPYALSKLAGEQAMATWSRTYGLSTVSLRYFNIFGPRQSADNAYAAVVAAFAKALLHGEAPKIYGDGQQSRDMTFVANAVLATLLAGLCPSKLMGEVINVGTGQRLTMQELAKKMAHACGMPHLHPTFLPERAGDVKHSLADITVAKQLLGYEPVASLDDGLAETIEWFKRAYTTA
ncbi:MAG TPA: GDP-mannose 4,6-dehydratase [Phycisphaerales bacterium]|jgi:nucleoside-diphosphate-sugar epimerase|nr:GDP-mannose 4,6-dehydratase [Phycisphaerales bacterium]